MFVPQEIIQGYRKPMQKCSICTHSKRKEIDEALYKHPMVQDAAAVGIPDESYGEEITACVVLKPGCTTTEEELRNHCLEHLGEFKAPKVIKLMADLPRGPSGKIQRLKLRNEYRAEERGVLRCVEN